MKRVFQLMIATAGTSVFVSCGGGADTTHTEPTVDSAAVAMPATSAVDSATMQTDSAAIQMDTTNMGTNTDSTATDSTVAVTDDAF